MSTTSGGRRLARVAYALAIACVGGILWTAWTGVQSLGQTPTAAAPALPVAEAPAAGATAPDPSAIPRWHLFGNPQKTAPAPPPRPVEAPPTRLRLSLEGVLAAERPEDARAIIGEAGKPARTYRLGEEIGAGVRLEAVRPASVLLRRNGRLETLALDREKEASRGAATADRRRPAAGSPPQPRFSRRDQ